MGRTSCSEGHSLDKPSALRVPGRCRVPVPHARPQDPRRLVLARTAIASVTVSMTLGSDGAMLTQLTQTFSPGGVLGIAVGCKFQSNCPPSPLCLQAEGVQVLVSGCLQRASPLQTLPRRKQPSPLPGPPTDGHPSKALPRVLQSPEPVAIPKASPLSPCVTKPAL